MFRSEGGSRPRAIGELTSFMPGPRTRFVADLTSRGELKTETEELHFREVSGDNLEQEIPAAADEFDAREEEREMTLHLRLAAAREEGCALARGQFKVELAAMLAEERRRVDRMRLEFARDRQRFFAAAEGQVVKLALAIAERVLAREVASDELHLRAIVKVALARVQDSSATTLRVPVEQADAWRAMMQRGVAGKVMVVGDEMLGDGDCVLETTVGHVELGVDVQLAEIERSFAALLQEPANSRSIRVSPGE